MNEETCNRNIVQLYIFIEAKEERERVERRGIYSY
jgi:hypothetical protein